MDDLRSEPLVVAISSRALFDLEKGHEVYVNEGVDAYCAYQVEREDELLEPGVAFPLVQKFLALNEADAGTRRVEVVLISRNSADTGLRIFNSIAHYGLDITRAAFSGGDSPFRYVTPFSADLYLSADPANVRQALQSQVAAATILPSSRHTHRQGQLRIAFDGDAVIFADDSERIYQTEGLAAFAASEKKMATTPMTAGPFRKFLHALHELQSRWPRHEAPIRTALFTARSAPAHERVIRTLRAWNVRIDEAVFLGGLDKGEFLRTFGADIFFDDQTGHCESASRYVATGHVPHGVTNDAA
jgi:5'-nucleotidase